MTAVTAVAVNGVTKAGEFRDTAQVYSPPSEVLRVPISIWLIVTFPSVIKGYTIMSSPLLMIFPPGPSHIISGVASSPSSCVAEQLIAYEFPAVLFPTALVETLKANGSSTERKSNCVVNVSEYLHYSNHTCYSCDNASLLASIRAGHSAGVLSAVNGVIYWVELQFQLLLVDRACYHLSTVQPLNGADVQVGGTGEGG